MSINSKSDVPDVVTEACARNSDSVGERLTTSQVDNRKPGETSLVVKSTIVQRRRRRLHGSRTPVHMKLVGLLPRTLLVVAFQSKWRHSWMRPVIDWGAGAFRNREGVIQRGVGKGLRFDPGNAHASYLLGMNEPDLQNALREILKPGMTFLDVGSTVGFQCMLAARLVGSSGRVVAFEPAPDNAWRIMRNARLNGFEHVSVREEALGNRDSEAEPFVLSVVPTGGRLGTIERPPEYPAGRINVRLRRLDTVMRETSMAVPDVIKVDVEGAEADVIKGAMGTIGRHRPIMLIELHATNVPVAAALEKLDNYSAIALEGSRDVISAHWNAYVVAVPSESEEVNATVRRLAREAALVPRRL